MRSLFITLMLIMFSFNAAAQDGALKGNVSSASDGEPLIGVSVVVKGTSRGGVTDFDGNYSISGLKKGDVIVFSYVGFTPKELAYAGQATLNVKLEEDSKTLDDVVVIGYGTMKKKLVTGATAQLKGDDVAKLNTTDPLQAMQGQTPGVNISTTSGQPGSSMKVSIRGMGTTGNSSPLYLIDGVSGDINTLNPADIESIDVLKDAASAAIYGAQAANGVVLVTTKSGKEGNARISFDAYMGWQNVARSPKLLNAEQYKMIMDEYAVNNGSAVYDWASMKSIWNEDGSPVDTDWFDAITKDNAMVESYNIGVTGGSKTSTYAMSLGYLYQEGIVGGKGVNDMNRYNFRINSEHKLYKDIITIGERVSIVYKDNHGVNDFSSGDVEDSPSALYAGSALRNALSGYPVNPIYGDDPYGTGYFSSTNSDWNTGTGGNPLGLLMIRQSKSKNWLLDANAYINVEPVKNLVFRSVFGIHYNNSKTRTFMPAYQFDQYTIQDYANVYQYAGDNHSMTWTNTLAYSWTMGEHALNALVGMEAYRYDGEKMDATNQNMKLGTDNWANAWLGNATATGKIASGFPENPSRTVSYFGRLGWNWKETYMVNATLRADGSSKFAPGHRWGYFPSVSAGWTVSNEKWMESTSKVMDYLKLRLSWGQVGNQNVDPFQYLATLATDAYYNNGSTTANVGTRPTRTANEELTWETSEQFNIGIDARFFKRLNVNLDYYVKTTKDWLVWSPTYATTGFDTALINGGDVRNSGFEFNLTWNDRIGKELQYNIGFNGAYNKNKVTSVPTDDGIIHGTGQILSDDNTEIYRAQTGHALGYFWGYKTAGIFQNQQEIEDWALAGNGIRQTDVKPGDVKYVDINHDGVIDDSDKVDLGNGTPKFTFGFNMGLNWKNFDFSVLLSGATGYKIMQAYRNYTSVQGNWTTAVLQRWTGEGTSNSVPRMSTKASGNYEFSDLFLQDGDYLRISNITLGYDFAPLLKAQWLSQARLYLQVQNLYTFTDYDGMDPEIGYGLVSWASGMDFGNYPRPRTFLIGINVKF